jgi:hypothetical protein
MSRPRYVVLLVFARLDDRVLLQKIDERWTAVSGVVADDERPLDANARLLTQEVSTALQVDEWQHAATIRTPSSEFFLYTGSIPYRVALLPTAARTLMWQSPSYMDLRSSHVHKALCWLLPLCQHTDNAGWPLLIETHNG